MSKKKNKKIIITESNFNEILDEWFASGITGKKKILKGLEKIILGNKFQIANRYIENVLGFNNLLKYKNYSVQFAKQSLNLIFSEITLRNDKKQFTKQIIRDKKGRFISLPWRDVKGRFSPFKNQIKVLYFGLELLKKEINLL